MTAWRRETLFLGRSEFSGEDGDAGDYDIHSEDDMVAIECTLQDGTNLEVFIGPNLFAEIRRVMDNSDRRFEKS